MKSTLSLDIGCWKNPCCYFNIDPDKDIIFNVSKKYSDRLFIIGDAEKLPFKNKLFSFIRVNDAIEHVQRPSEMLVEIKRCFRESDGTLFIRTPIYPNKIIYDQFFHRLLLNRSFLSAL